MDTVVNRRRPEFAVAYKRWVAALLVLSVFMLLFPARVQAASSRKSAVLDPEFSAVIAACHFPKSSRILHVSQNSGSVSTASIANGARGSRSGRYSVRTEFSTIQAAVDMAANGDIIAVEPGIYNESVDCHDKIINLVGRSRDTCIISYPVNNYFQPPLSMSAGSLWNITVHGMAAESSSSNVVHVPAYCLHVDYDLLTGSSLYVNNCSFVNDQNCAAGIGLRDNSSVEFYNCSFCSTGGGEALYFHDCSTSGEDCAGQRLILRGCTLAAVTTTTATVSIHSQETGTFCADVLFENNHFYNYADGMVILLSSSSGEWLNGTGYLGSSDFTLSSLSAGNNCALMNYDTYAPVYVEYATQLANGQSSANLGLLQKNFPAGN